MLMTMKFKFLLFRNAHSHHYVVMWNILHTRFYRLALGFNVSASLWIYGANAITLKGITDVEFFQLNTFNKI